jgi:hypothetical protein
MLAHALLLFTWITAAGASEPFRISDEILRAIRLPEYSSPHLESDADAAVFAELHPDQTKARAEAALQAFDVRALEEKLADLKGKPPPRNG